MYTCVPKIVYVFQVNQSLSTIFRKCLHLYYTTTSRNRLEAAYQPDQWWKIRGGFIPKNSILRQSISDIRKQTDENLRDILPSSDPQSSEELDGSLKMWTKPREERPEIRLFSMISPCNPKRILWAINLWKYRSLWRQSLQLDNQRQGHWFHVNVHWG